MKTVLFFVRLVLVATATAQQAHEPTPNGVIYGTVIGENGKPAKGVGLVAWPAMALGTRLPSTTSNDAGEYRFENLPWWGKYGVAVEDRDAGYSMLATGGGRNDPPGVELTSDHREAELKVYLAEKAGFLHIHLTNRKTGAAILGCMSRWLRTRNQVRRWSA